MSIQTSTSGRAEEFSVAASALTPLAINEMGMSRVLNIGGEASPSTIMMTRALDLHDATAISFGVKRAIDIVASLILIVLLSPVLIAAAAAVMATSKGPVFFTQKRWGKGNAPFALYKFRSMYVDMQDKSGVAHTIRNDPRVTPVGRFIRKYSIDELPQLFNVLMGDLSLVGPRAHARGMRAAGVLYEDLVPEYFARHAVRPGITGLAQVRGLRGEVTDAAHARGRVAAVREYIRSFSILTDIKILLATIPAVITGRDAF